MKKAEETKYADGERDKNCQEDSRAYTRIAPQKAHLIQKRWELKRQKEKEAEKMQRRLLSNKKPTPPQKAQVTAEPKDRREELSQGEP